MFKSLLLIALRNFKKDRWYNLLNILGLTLGITFSLFLIFYVADELNYDRYHKNANRIFRVVSYIQEREKNTNWTITQKPLAPTLKRDYPEVEEAVRFFPKERTLFKYNDKSFYETKVYYADSNVFKVFTYPLIAGDPATALKNPNSIVISQSLAEKYFGENVPAVGKTIKTVYDVYKITGVMKDVPRNSHLLFDMLISSSTIIKGPGNPDEWGNFNNFTYVLLSPQASVAELNQKLSALYEKYIAALFAKFNVKMQYGVQPITAIHLHSTLEREPEELGSMSYIWTFSAVAFLMLLIACINYMNITTARSARRAKEIGVRKVFGSAKKRLVIQFLGESLITAVLSVFASIVLVLLLIHPFNSISGKTLTWHLLYQPFTLLVLICVTLFTGLVGGSYPAFYLSSFNPIHILKGTLAKASGNAALRKTLVVVQFSISMIMLICTWTVYKQLSFLHQKDLGFNKDQVMTVIVNTGEDERSKIFAMNNDFRKLPGVSIVGSGNGYPGNGQIDLNLYSVQTTNGYVNKTVENYAIDEHFLPALDMHVIAGRNFSGPSDTLHSIIVNESMAKQFGGDNAIGKRIRYVDDTSARYHEVIGIVKDFNQKSLYNSIAPLIFFYGQNGNMIQLKLAVHDPSTIISSLSGIWKTYFPALPFEYKFLDDDFNSQYAADQRRGKIFAAFSLMTIIITCLGLLGLTAFTTQQKQKEISMRRVMGASIFQIVVLITKAYFWLVVIAAAIAFPVAGYFMSKWLDLFPYHSALSVIPFLIAALIISFTAGITASFYSAKAAMTRPAKVLKSE